MKRVLFLLFSACSIISLKAQQITINGPAGSGHPGAVLANNSYILDGPFYVESAVIDLRLFIYTNAVPLI